MPRRLQAEPSSLPLDPADAIAALEAVLAQARRYLQELDDAGSEARQRRGRKARARGPLPEEGDGTQQGAARPVRDRRRRACSDFRPPLLPAARVLIDHGGEPVRGFRPAFVNWRTTREDAALVVEVVRDLGGALSS